MEPEPQPRLPVVGIGASAGGVRALQDLFASLPPDTGAAFVVIVHLSPSQPSELASILASRTSMRVVQVKDRMRLDPDTVYVIPPDRQLTITATEVSESPFDEPRNARAPIDMFFRSLAEEHGESFAVVLSGGGSDGAVGVRSIREKGGLILAQDPDEAEFGSMPRNAIAAGVDFVLPVREIASQLQRLIRASASLASGFGGADGDSEAVLQQILALLKARTGQDFAHYKRATVVRRLARRMQVSKSENLADYLTFLRDHPTEAQALFNDLLISVTSFFRDADAFKALAAKVIPIIFDRAQIGGSIRVWVPACATGEEAYSIAMLLLDESDRRKLGTEIQVFASDLDGQALAIAREGRYPAAIAADVSEEHLCRYFTKEHEHFRVRPEVRDRIVFAQHSVLKDPPFSRVDLVSCRNFLIYLDRDLQQQACAILHYALVPCGYLFLGASENAENPPGLFTVVDRDSRIYAANPRQRGATLPLPLPLEVASARPAPLREVPSRRLASHDSDLHARALEYMSPPSMLVDAGYRVLNFSETAGRYLLQPKGPPTSDAAELVRPELRVELLAGLHAALERRERVLTLPIPVQFNGEHHSVILQVAPVPTETPAKAALVLFVEGGTAESELHEEISGGQVPLADLLRNELSATRSQLRNTREQYEGAIEELRAANEELQSINEEYRSTAEELETSKEELQSINEELQTVNQELKTKLELVSRSHSDLQNLITATDIGTMFLDADLRIRLFTPRICNIFNITRGDEGRAVTDFTHQLEYQDLVADSRRVLAELVPIEQTVQAAGDRWFLVRLRPYRTIDDRIDGVVFTFVDITERRRSDLAWETRQSILVGELSHRVKNSLAVVQAIINFSLLDAGVAGAVVSIIQERLQALSRSHDLLVRTEWKGASLDAIAREQLAPYIDEATDRLRMTGLPTILPPNLATPLGLILHELATNALKHGAWTVPDGRVDLGWQHRAGENGALWLDVTWRESGGPQPPEGRPSTGMKLIQSCVAGSVIRHDLRPEGLLCEIAIPMSNPELRQQ